MIDSGSVGDPARFATFAALSESLRELRTPTDDGRVALIVRRGHNGLRETLDRATLTVEDGLPGDVWGLRKAKIECQITAMQHDVATMLANGQPLTLFGDNLFLHLDLSTGNLPPGSLVRVGTATLAVTPKPHNGCKKFLARFGREALDFCAFPETRHRNFRGIHLRVIESGDVAVGDSARMVSRD